MTCQGITEVREKPIPIRLYPPQIPSRLVDSVRGSVCVGFVVDRVALNRFFFRVLQFHPVKVIPPVFHAHFLFSYHPYHTILTTDNSSVAGGGGPPWAAGSRGRQNGQKEGDFELKKLSFCSHKILNH